MTDTVTVSFSIDTLCSVTGTIKLPTNVEVDVDFGGGVTCGSVGAAEVVVVEEGVDCVTVTKSVVVVVAIVGGVRVMVMKVRASAEEDDAPGVVPGFGTVISTVVAEAVNTAPAADVVVVAAAVKPRTLDAVASSVHSTTTPSVEFIGIAKHSEPAAHTLTTKLPASLQVPTLPERQAMLPGVHEEEKPSVAKNLL